MPVHVHITEGTANHPAGIPLGGKTAHYENEQSFRPFQSIDLVFYKKEGTSSI